MKFKKKVIDSVISVEFTKTTAPQVLGGKKIMLQAVACTFKIKGVEKVYLAKCSPKDNFNLNKGAKLAFKRGLSELVIDKKLRTDFWNKFKTMPRW